MNNTVERPHNNANAYNRIMRTERREPRCTPPAHLPPKPDRTHRQMRRPVTTTRTRVLIERVREPSRVGLSTTRGLRRR
eukprot:8074991-Pyramimonas_sp.AAC.2